jgi:hypothetical protein
MYKQTHLSCRHRVAAGSFPFSTIPITVTVAVSVSVSVSVPVSIPITITVTISGTSGWYVKPQEERVDMR